jgi:Tol biopolymer transport system component
MKSPFNTPGLVDIYMTKDNRIIFYGEKLWISDTDTIRVEQITPDNLTLTHLPSRLSQSPDGSKLYFAADKNIYQLSYPDYQLTQLTHQTTRWLRNPIVSDLGNYITYSSDGFGYPTKETEYMYWLNLINGQSDIIPSPDTLSFNPYYSEIEDYVYYERAGLFRSRLDGSDRTTVDNYGGSGEPYTMFSISNDQRYIVHKSNPTYNNYFVRIFDKVCFSGVNLPVKNSPPYELLGRLCKEANIVFYISPGYPEKLHSYRLDTGEDTILNPNQVNIANTYIIAPTWDGSKVYFYADIEVK